MSYQDPEEATDIWRDEYWPDFRRNVHELLVVGYKTAKCKIQPSHEEPDITGFIAEAIQAYLESPESPEWCDRISLHEDPPVPGGRRTGRGRKKPDLIFEALGRRPRAKFFFESKRLREQSSHRESYYLGPEGIQRFLRGAYAREYPEAGMIGYIQCDTVDIWNKRLQAAITVDAQNKNELRLKSLPQKVQIIEEISQEWTSSHYRHPGGYITIFHILFDCCP